MKKKSIPVALMLLSSTCLSMGSQIVNAVTVANQVPVDAEQFSRTIPSIETDQPLEESSELPQETEENESQSMDSTELQASASESSGTDMNEGTSPTLSGETEEEVATTQETEETVFNIIFRTTGEHLFVDKQDNDRFEMMIEKNKNEKLSLKDLPTFGYTLDNLQINGWQDFETGVIYTAAELFKLKLVADMVLTPIFLEATYPNVFGLAELPPLPVDKKIKVIKEIFAPAAGTGPEYSSDGRILLINPAKKSQLGSIWSKKRLNMAKDFTFKAYLNMGNSEAKGADGITFTLQNDPTGKKALANSGQGLGAYSVYGNTKYIQNALSVEFDTFYNGGSRDPMDSDLDKNGNRGHIAFVTPSKNNNQKKQHTGVTYPTEYLSNNKWRQVIFNWDAKLKNLSYDLVGIGGKTYHIDDVEQQFGGYFVDWGFTSSTGGQFQDNAVAITDVPTSVSHVASIKNDTENEVDYGTETIGAPGDIISITDTIELDDSEPKFGKDALVEIDLTGIDYQEDSLLLDGEPIPKGNITYVNNSLSVSIGKLIPDSKQSAKLTLQAKVGDLPVESTHSYYFTYTEDGVSSDSNFVDLTIPKVVNKTINVHYVDVDTDESLAESTEITGKIGSAYEAKAKTISGYELVKDSGNTTGTLSKESQDVTFYYKKGILSLKEVPTLFDFKKHKVGTKEQIIWPELTGDLVVSDTRGESATGWHLNVKEVQSLQSDNQSLGNVLTLTNGQGETTVTAADITVESSEKTGETVITDEWGQDKKLGINAKVPVEKQLKGDYQGILEWSLLDTP